MEGIAVFQSLFIEETVFSIVLEMFVKYQLLRKHVTVLENSFLLIELSILTIVSPPFFPPSAPQLSSHHHIPLPQIYSPSIFFQKTAGLQETENKQTKDNRIKQGKIPHTEAV